MLYTCWYLKKHQLGMEGEKAGFARWEAFQNGTLQKLNNDDPKYLFLCKAICSSTDARKRKFCNMQWEDLLKYIRNLSSFKTI